MRELLKLREELPRLLPLLSRMAEGLAAPQDVDDLVQDAIVNILIQNSEIEPINPRGYLAMCLYSARANWYVRAARHKRSAETVPIDDCSEIDQCAVAAAQPVCVELNEAIANLKRLPRLWAEAIRIGIDAESVSEIAEIMGRPTETVRTWLKKARAALRNPDTVSSYRGPLK